MRSSRSSTGRSMRSLTPARRQAELHGALGRRERHAVACCERQGCRGQGAVSCRTRCRTRRLSTRWSAQLEKAKWTRAFGGEEGAPAESEGSVYDQQAAAGCRRAAWLQCAPHDGRGAAAVRGRGDWQRGHGRSDHLHAYRFDARERRMRLRRLASYIGKLGAKYLPAKPNEYVGKKQVAGAGCARGDPSDQREATRRSRSGSI